MFPDTAPKPGETICKLEDIADHGAWSKVWGEDHRNLFPLMITRREQELYAYANVCPHQFLPLDNYMGEFLNEDGKLFVCLHHGAVFRVEDGLCVSGPCRGTSLLKVNVELRGDDVVMGPWPELPPRPLMPDPYRR